MGFSELQTITYHSNKVTGIKFGYSSKWLGVAGYGDGKLTLWAFDKVTDQYQLRSSDSLINPSILAFDSLNHLVSCSYNTSSCIVYTLRLNCSEDSHSNGQNAGDYECICAGAYRWNNSSFTCQLDCSGQSNAQPSINVSNGSCSCVSGYYWNSVQCYLNCSMLPNTLNNTDSTSCNCIAGY